MKYVGWDAPSGPAERCAIGPQSEQPRAEGTFAKTPQPRLEDMTEEELAQFSSLGVRKYGHIDQPTLEALLVAMFLADPDTDKKYGEIMKTDRQKEAEEVFASGMRGEWFDNKFLGAVFERLRESYRENRQTLTIDEAGVLCSIQGQTSQQVIMYKDELYNCLALLLLRKTRAHVLIRLMTDRHRNKTVDKLYQRLVAKRKDPGAGLSKAIDDFRISVIQDLADPGGSVVKEYDWFGEYKETMSKLVDMKRYPEKYVGYKCGIDAIDKKTNGFRPGHLTVFVGSHGGFKTTTMVNVGYGLWENSYNVLYVSLEMEADEVKPKIWCRATRKVKFSRLNTGNMSDASDDAELRSVEDKLRGELDDAERQKLKKYAERLRAIRAGTKPGEEDRTLIDKFYESHKEFPNRFKIINVGQSSKIKCSQIEQWLKEKEGEFRPHVVILDYLDLVAPETPYPDRRDLELGDICKYLRQMGLRLGFAVITAAQFKRNAMERIRKNGVEQIQKAQMGTDDISGSHQIGADADEVFMLFREKGGTSIKMLTAKARHGIPDVEQGETLQVDPDTCYISSANDVEPMAVRNSRASLADGFDTLRAMQNNEIQLDPDVALPDSQPPVDMDVHAEGGAGVANDEDLF